MEKPTAGMKGKSKAVDLYLQKPNNPQAIFPPEEPSFGKIPQALIKDRDLSPQCRFIYAAYHMYATQKYLSKGTCAFPSQKRISKECTTITERHFRRLVFELKENGWITVIKLGLGLPNIIVLHAYKGEKIPKERKKTYKEIVLEKMKKYKLY